MEFTKEQLYAYQALQYFVLEKNYQIVQVRQKNQDLWLMNPEREDYPILHISFQQVIYNREYFLYLKTAYEAIARVIGKNQPLFVLHTCENYERIEEEGIVQIQIQPNDISDEKFSEVFEELKNRLHDEENIEFAIKKVQEALYQKQKDLLKKYQKQTNVFRQIPKLTGIIIGICVAYWFIILLASNYLQDSVVASILLGAYYKMNVVSMHEYWRFLTSGFMHSDILHLMMNMLALIYVGIVCEKVFKKTEYITILLVSIVVGNTLVFLTQGNILGLGISGGVFGLLGAYIAVLFENGSMKNPFVRSSVSRLLMMNLLISLLPGISLFAHLGGFMSGVFLGIIFVPSRRWLYLKKHVLFSFLAFLFVLFLCIPKVNVVDPLYKEVDAKVLRTVRLLGMDSYEKRMRAAYLDYYTKEDLGL